MIKAAAAAKEGQRRTRKIFYRVADLISSKSASNVGMTSSLVCIT